MSKYKPLRKANVIIYKNFKPVYNGMRTLYMKDFTGKKYIRYKNRYYHAFFSGYNNTYIVRLSRWYNARVLFSDWTPR